MKIYINLFHKGSLREEIEEKHFKTKDEWMNLI